MAGLRSGGVPQVNTLTLILACDHDFLSLQKRGFKSLYKIRITDADLHVHYNTLEGFMDSFAEHTAAVNNGVAISVHIEDLDELPQAKLKVLPHLQ